MTIQKVLTSDVIRLDLPGTAKEEILGSLLDILVDTGKVRDRQAAFDALLEREKKMSTGIENGVAIPHGKTDAVDELIACVALKKEGVDFDSLDGLPSTIFIMTLSPLDRSGPHVQFLAEVSRLLQDEQGREEILAATDVQQILDAFL
jgi:PTS system nitrogen regulatory IIA component